MAKYLCGLVAALLLLSCVADQVPSAPVVTGSSTCEKGAKATVTVKSTHRQKLEVCYKVSWGDGAVDDWGDLVPSGIGTSISHVFQRVGDVSVMSRAKDASGKESDWSSHLPLRFLLALHLRRLRLKVQ